MWIIKDVYILLQISVRHIEVDITLIRSFDVCATTFLNNCTRKICKIIACNERYTSLVLQSSALTVYVQQVSQSIAANALYKKGIEGFHRATFMWLYSVLVSRSCTFLNDRSSGFHITFKTISYSIFRIYATTCSCPKCIPQSVLAKGYRISNFMAISQGFSVLSTGIIYIVVYGSIK